MEARGAAIAPYPVRFRLAVAGLALAWALAGLFLFLGIRTQQTSAATLDQGPAVAASR